jgi:hypothetical protein
MVCFKLLSSTITFPYGVEQRSLLDDSAAALDKAEQRIEDLTGQADGAAVLD